MNEKHTGLTNSKQYTHKVSIGPPTKPQTDTHQTQTNTLLAQITLIVVPLDMFWLNYPNLNPLCISYHKILTRTLTLTFNFIHISLNRPIPYPTTSDKLVWPLTRARISSNINNGSPDPPWSINPPTHHITNTRTMYILTPQGRAVPCPLQWLNTQLW